MGRNADSGWFCPIRNTQAAMDHPRTHETDGCDSLQRACAMVSEECTEDIARDRESSRVVVVGVLLPIISR